jgi:putative ABC transport system ATP-binding protein
MPHRREAGVIELRRVTKSFREGERDRVIFRDLDATISTGEKVALLGRSGSGKSTLLNLISGIDLPDRGEVLIEGDSLTAMGERDRTLFRRRHVGFVFQFFNLIPTLTVEENLLLPLELTRRVDRRDRDAARALLDEVGLADRADGFPDRLSGGEQQRIAVARALIHEPALVLADEPTGNLDLETGRRVLELLLGLVGERSRTLVMVTHSQEVAASADRVLSVRDGGLVERSLREGGTS